MTVTQIKDLVNNVTKEDLGLENVLNEDLTNVVDVGKSIIDSDNVDNYVKSIVNRIGKTVFSNRKYNGRGVNVLMDSWEYGSIVQKITADLPSATENKSWELVDGTEYSPNVFYKPSVSVKFFNSKTTFEIPMSFTERQVKESFKNQTELNAFLSLLRDSIDKSLTIKIDGLIMRTINNMIAHTYNLDNKGLRAINLLEKFNNATSSNLTVANCLTDSDFLRFASKEISLYISRLGVLSTLFNSEGKPKFTPKDMLHLITLADFASSYKTYLTADTYHKELVELPKYETVPYWQGSGENYDFANCSKINVKIDDNGTTKDIELGGILAVMFDHDALGVTNEDRRVTSNYNPKAEFYNNWYKFDCSYFNDLSENFIVFYVADSVKKATSK